MDGMMHMRRLIGFLIFGVLIVLIYIGFRFFLGQFPSLNSVFTDLPTRFASEKVLGVVVLVGYSFLVAGLLIALGRWMLDLVFTLVDGVQNILSGRRQQAATAETLENRIIIDQPALNKPRMRLLETIFSAVVWVFFIYLFQTIFTTAFWLLGLEHIYSYTFTRDSIESTIDAMVFAMYTAIASMIVMFAWAQWNLRRYGRLDRRKPRPPVSQEEVAKEFEIPLDTVNQMQSAKIAVIQTSPRGIVYKEVTQDKPQ